MSARTKNGQSAPTAVGFTDARTHLLAGLACVDLRMRSAVAKARSAGLDPQDDFRGLYVSDQHIDDLLGYSFGDGIWQRNLGEFSSEAWQPWATAYQEGFASWRLRSAADTQSGRYPLERIIHAFGLSDTEIEVLLLAIAADVDLRYERFFAYLQDDVTRKRPTVDCILNLLSTSLTEKLTLHTLFAADSTLVGQRLLTLSTRDGGSQLSRVVRPAVTLVQLLLGDAAISPRLRHVARLESGTPRRAERVPADLLDVVKSAAERAAHPPLLVLVGRYGVGKLELAQQLAAQAERPLLRADLKHLAETVGLDEGLPLLLRDGRCHQAVLYLTGWEGIDNYASQHQQQLVDYPHLLLLTAPTNWQPKDIVRQRAVINLSFDLPDYTTRLALWQAQLGTGQELRQVANHFRFTAGQIEDVVATAKDLAFWRNGRLDERDLFAASRAHSSQALAEHATKIQPRYGWDDIILPSDPLALLREMVNTVEQRPVVYDQWGFDQKMALGKGLYALFAGESGTGKTMSADIMAGELGLDLYRIDLSMLISKYIGETEKNLEKIFTAAETSNAILFFDEADAVFGKRSEVKDAHDRYANIEVSYLLQRMESYDGIVILATNLRANIDEAFTRRLHFVVEFPFPDVVDRQRIWQVTIPPETPLATNIDFKTLATRFRLAGGNIRNIILAAAFLAAEEERPLGMTHLLHAARREYQKMGRLIDEHLFEV